MVLRRIKDKVRRLIQRKRKTRSVHETPSSRLKAKAREKEAVSAPAKEYIGTQETAVEKTKFSHPEVARPRRVALEELPGTYNRNQIVLQVRDPWWLHSYWEVTPSSFEELKGRLGDAFYSAKRVLRVYDVSHIIFDGTNAHRFFDIEVGHDATSWYIDTGGPGRSWCVDFGLRLPNGDFITIVRSNTVNTPLEGPSWITDEEWMVPEDMFARLYGMGFGFGRSSPVGKAWQERMRRELFSGILASPGMASMASPVKPVLKQRQFWLVVNTELIVYGATEPDAKVCVQGREIRLRPDGTFTMRFALPDGKQVIPVQATSADGVETRTITPIVTKETK